MIIAVDGPAGAGKSTVARILAQELGFLYIDTGAMYRSLALKVIETNISLSDLSAVIGMAHKCNISLQTNEGGRLKVILDGKDVSKEIRQPRVTKIVSDIAKIKEVREVLVGIQRKLGRQQDSVFDGRDIGTIVFPEANKKFYVDAQFEERAMRRYKEIKSSGQEVTLDEVKIDLANRDTIDSTRQFGPLKKADDAIYIDTTNMTIEEVVDRLVKEVNG